MLVCMCLSVCFDPVPPPPGHGLCKGNLWCLWSLNHEFWQKLINQKLLSTPDLEGVGHLFRPQIRIQKDLGPMSFWSQGPSLSRGVYKLKVVVNVPNSACPQGPGRPMSGYLNMLE